MLFRSGDFGERQTDYALSGNGIVFAGGTEKPPMQEARYWYASPAGRARHDGANEWAKRTLALPARKGKKGPLRIVHGDGALGVRGEGFEVLFSYAQSGPVSLAGGGREWLWRAPRPAYWRAPTENDVGNGFTANSSIWAASTAGGRTWRRRTTSVRRRTASCLFGSGWGNEGGAEIGRAHV